MAVVRTGSPIISAHSVISLLVVKMIDDVSYVSLMKVKNLLACALLIGVYPISSMMTNYAFLMFFSRKPALRSVSALSRIFTKLDILSKHTV